MDANVSLITKEDIWYPVLKAEFYLIMCSNLPLRSKLGAGRGPGHHAERVASVPHAVPGPAENVSFQNMSLQVAVTKVCI